MDRRSKESGHNDLPTGIFMDTEPVKKYFSLWEVASLGIGSMIGAGIFALMGQTVLAAGKGVFASFLIGGVVALLSGYSYAKLGSRYPDSGGLWTISTRLSPVNYFRGHCRSCIF